MSGRPAGDLSDDVWHRFLYDVIHGIREAVRRVNDPVRLAIFEERIGWFGKPRSGFKGTRFPDETSISKALIEVLTEMRAAQFIGAPATNPAEPNLTNMEFHVEVDRKYDPGIGPNAQPTDFQFAIHRDRIDLRIEAKKLARPSEVVKYYLGEQGLGRFDDVNAPYTLERFGGMLAYVTDFDTATWAGHIEDGLRSTLPAERLAHTIVSGEPLITSVHDRDVDIKLHKLKGRFRTDVIHLVLEFEARPSRRAPPSPEVPKPPKRRRTPKETSAPTGDAGN